jgi:hypothetical protein
VKCSQCPVRKGYCLGEQAARLCVLAKTRPDYRGLLVEQAREAAATSGHPPSLDALLAAVAACRFRGKPLPHSAQAECGCGELIECRAGRGKVPGRVTLRDCLACVSTRRHVETMGDAPSPS